MKNNSFLYSLKIWLTTLLLTPFVIIFFQYCFEAIGLIRGLPDFRIYGSSLKDIMETFFLIIIVSFLFTFIAWLLLWLFIYLINKADRTIKEKKTFVTIFTTIITIFIFGILLSDFQEVLGSTLHIMLAYLINLTSCIWFYRFPIQQFRQISVNIEDHLVD